MRILFLTPAPDYREDWEWAYDPQSEPLRARGAQVDTAAWNSAADFSGCDVVLPLICWGYHLRFVEWMRFVDRLEADRIPVVNPAALLRWNSDKAYLSELIEKGVATVPSMAVGECCDHDLEEARKQFGQAEIVVKPPISAGAFGTYRLHRGEGVPAELEGRRAIIQPLMNSVVANGEYSLILFDGKLSHAVLKRPKPGDFRVQPHLGGVTTACEAPPGSEALAQAALAAAPRHATYARIDMVEGPDGKMMIMEMELVEPALFLAEAPHGEAAFAEAILSAAERLVK